MEVQAWHVGLIIVLLAVFGYLLYAFVNYLMEYTKPDEGEDSGTEPAAMANGPNDCWDDSQCPEGMHCVQMEGVVGYCSD